MEYRRPAKAGLKVSTLSMGSWVTFGRQVDLGEAKALRKTAYDAGVNFLDNAEVHEATDPLITRVSNEESAEFEGVRAYPPAPLGPPGGQPPDLRPDTEWRRVSGGDRGSAAPGADGGVLMRGRRLGLLVALVAVLIPTVIRAQDPAQERAVFRAIEENRAGHLAFLQSLVQAQDEGEEAVQALVAQRFQELGMEVETLRLVPIQLSPDLEFAAQESIDPSPRISVVGRMRGAGTGRSLLFFGHPDPEAMTEASMAGWTHDPFAGEVENGRIYGWGVADDLTGVAIMAEALAAILETAGRPAGEILLASTPAKRSARGILGVLNEGYHADAAVYLHPAESEEGLEDIKAITSGMLQFRIVVRGRGPDTREPGQTAFAHRAVNAMDKATLLLSALRELDRRRGQRVFNPALDAAVGRSTNLLASHISCGEAGRTTRVPTECVVEASITFPPDERMPEVRREIEAALEDAASRDPWLRENTPKVEWLFGTQGVEVSGDHPLYRTVHEAVVEVTGVEPKVNPLHSASDIKNPNLFSGIPSVGIGPLAGDLTQAGSHDEWVDVEDYIRTIKICAKIILDWSG